ncbi:MAG: SIR2 family protein [Ramlibacter sp.]|nr:SIR2 family protein [Ramlibacter sp.]
MPPPAAAAISVRDTLDLLDSSFPAFAEGVANGRYAFWLGSGISLGVVPGLWGVVEAVIEFLRAKRDPADAACKFNRALGEALQLAGLNAAQVAALDLTIPLDAWSKPVSEPIVSALLKNYGRLLAIRVGTEPFDYLVWNVVKVPETYAAVALQPDVEHLCLAALSLEGIATDMVSANWDPLVERAVTMLTNGNGALNPTVVAKPDEVQLPRNRARIIKFHGCAAKAAANEADYRPWLVARHAQINGWCGNPLNLPFMTALVALINEKPTFMLGLSAQDGNIQHVFQTAAKQIAWDIKATPPGYVFSENELGLDQKSLLENVYGNQITPANYDAICDAARIQAFAKPLLTALLLDVLSRKLVALIGLMPGPLPGHERQPLIDGIKRLRNDLASAAATSVPFIVGLLERWARASQLLRAGEVAQPDVKYMPISADAIPGMAGNQDHAALGLREAAVALGLLGAGVARGDWTLESEPAATGAGVVAVTSTLPGATRTKVYLTANAYFAMLLVGQGELDEAEAPILIQAKPLTPSMSRSPRGSFGRTGVPPTREISIASMMNVCVTFDELYADFRRELAI